MLGYGIFKKNIFLDHMSMTCYLFNIYMFLGCVHHASETVEDYNQSNIPAIKEDLEQDHLSSSLQQHIEGYVNNGQFSGAILVARSGKVIYRGAYGWADVENKVKNTVNTRFLIGSTTKSFTATLAMKFVDLGYLKLDRPISEYLPDIDEDLGNSLTLHHLLKMQSGLPNHMARLTRVDERELTMSEMLDIINTSELAFKPGTDYAYSNLNYHLIAAILESVSGKAYADLIKEYIFLPLNMANSASGAFDDLKDNKAYGYHVDDLSEAEWNNLSFATGSGCIHSTIDDLYLWDKALYDNFLTEKSRDLMFDGAADHLGNYGYGFRVVPYYRNDKKNLTGILVRHGGTMRGYLANVHRYLDDQLTVIVLGNISMFPIRDLTFELKNMVLGIPSYERTHE